MSERTAAPPPEDPAEGPEAPLGRLWPPPEYARQVERLRAAIGETVYIAELEVTEVQLAVRLTDKPYVLLGLADFPRPDPARGLTPHLVILDDGRGVNLGRIARISRGRPFAPPPADVLFQDRAVADNLLFADRRLSPEQIARRSRQVLGEMLGQPEAGAAERLSGPEGGDEA